MIIVYVFQCDNNKYYIGTSKEGVAKMELPLNDLEWIKKYPIVNVIDVFPTPYSSIVDKTTILYMKKFGIDNVRGGKYRQFELSDFDKKKIAEFIENNNNVCEKCGSNDHTFGNGFCLFNVNWSGMTWTCLKCNEQFNTETKIKHHICKGKTKIE